MARRVAFRLLLVVALAAGIPGCAVTGLFTYGVRNSSTNSIGVGDPAPDVPLFDVFGGEHRLMDHHRGRPLVLIFGSFT